MHAQIKFAHANALFWRTSSQVHPPILPWDHRSSLHRNTANWCPLRHL